MARESLLNSSFDPEQATVEVATNIDAQGLYVPFDRVRSTVYSLTERATVKQFLWVIVPRVAERELLPVAIPKDSTLPRLLPETILDPQG